jgi:hypothetical protein
VRSFSLIIYSTLSIYCTFEPLGEKVTVSVCENRFKEIAKKTVRNAIKYFLKLYALVIFLFQKQNNSKYIHFKFDDN